MAIRVLAWNCRGLVNVQTQGALVSLVYQKRPDIVFLSETLAHPALLKSLRGKMGFAGCVCVPMERNSRGLGVFWSYSLQVNLRHYSYHHIDAEVLVPNMAESWHFTCLYGYARAEDKIHTWNLMRTLGRQSPLPWLVVGDVNEVLCSEEKFGGLRRQDGPMLRFREALVDCNLEDMGFIGSRFTWSNKYTKEHLDRGLSSFDWRELFPHFRVITLPPSDSDHSPLLVEGRNESFHFVPSHKFFSF